jgi:hypothetical protein
MTRNFLADLRRHQVRTAGEMMAAVQRARENLRERIRNAAADVEVAREPFRQAFYGRVAGIYELLGEELDGQLRAATELTANRVREATIQKIRSVGGKSRQLKAPVLKFDAERMRRYWEMIHPENEPGLAAVFTQRMAAEEIQGLRNAVTRVFRQGDLEAWTARERVKELQRVWDEAAGDANPMRFIAKDGREWTNARYLQMLVRTTQARVAREAQIDTLVENGDDLARVMAAGDNCPVCEAWNGLILSVTGTDDRYPSYEQAIEAGLFHPNCDCMLERVDETVHQAEAKAQGEAKNPQDWSDLEEMQSYREAAGLEEADREEPEGKGEFAKEAGREFLKVLEEERGREDRVVLDSPKDLHDSTLRRWELLTGKEREATRDYTGGQYQHINRAAARGEPNADLDSAIEKLPRYRGFLERGVGAVGVYSDRDWERWKSGEYAYWGSNVYLSTTINPEMDFAKQGFRVLIQNKGIQSGGYIGDKSSNPGEDEYLIGRNAKFRVMGWGEESDRGERVRFLLVEEFDPATIPDRQPPPPKLEYGKLISDWKQRWISPR